MAEEWGPWIEHDGKGCPCVGDWVLAEFEGGDVEAFRAGEFLYGDPDVAGSSWHWGTGWDEIIRYRIRRPRGLTILQELVEKLPETAEA